MSLVSTYNPDSQAMCPHCQKLVHCDMIGGITFGADPYYDFKHHDCGTTWRWHSRTGEVETPIPVPMTLREMMGEDNWRKQKEKEQLERAAPDLMRALIAMLDGTAGANLMAKDALAKARDVRID